MTPRTIRHVLKAAEVTLDDPVQLSIDPTTATDCNGSRSVPAGTRVRVTQSHPDYAMIEVTCSCGRMTYVRCDYAAANSSPVRPEPTQG